MKTYFCPRGCNVLDTNQEEPECASCGRIMTTDPDAFDSVHERIEEEGIAEVERRARG